MSQRSASTRPPSRSTQPSPGRYNPHAGATGVLALDPQDGNQPIVGQFDEGSRDTDIVQRPKQQVTSSRPANAKSQRVSSTKTQPANRIAGARRTKGAARRKAKAHDLKATVAPLLATVGLLLLIPAVWATLLLVGVGVPGAEREDSRPMAAIMLLSWPIAICLITASVAFFVQVLRQNRKPARRG